MGVKAQKAAARKVLAEFKAPAGSEIPSFEEVTTLELGRLKALKKSPSHIANCERAKRLYLDAEFGLRPVNQIRVADLEDLMQRLVKRLAASTVLGILSFASGTFRYAMKKEWRSDNPALLVDRPEPHRDDEIHYLTIADCERLIAAVTDDSRGRVEAVLYRTAAMAGLRRSELLALRWRDIDFDNELIRVSKAYQEGLDVQTKGKKGRYVPLAPQLRLALEAFRQVTRYPDPEGRVFGHPETNKPMDPSYVSKKFKKTCIRAGVGEVEIRTYKRRGRLVEEEFCLFRFHDLRHSFCTHAAMNPRVSLSDIQSWAGHASAATTEKYRHFQPAADEAKRLGEAFSRAGGGDPSLIPQSASNSPELAPTGSN